MRQKRPYRVGAILLTVLLFTVSLVPTCFAAGSIGEVNLHVGQSADTVYLTYTSSKKAVAPGQREQPPTRRNRSGLILPENTFIKQLCLAWPPEQIILIRWKTALIATALPLPHRPVRSPLPS